MKSDRVAVIGAGVGGLAAAIDLASRGLEVVVVESEAGPGGKMRTARIGDLEIDAGPTVLTMRTVFDELFADAGASLEDHVSLVPLKTLARHAWSASEGLDLFDSVERSADAIGDFAGAIEAHGFVAFTQRSREIFETLEKSFIRAQQPSPIGLVSAAGFSGLSRLARISPFASMWRELGHYFHDPRLRQLFGRYATYCGSSPFDAPATLMLVAHAEQRGVWSVDGGMRRLSGALAQLAERNGAVIRYQCRASEILTSQGQATGVRLSSGEVITANAVICNGDVSALAQGVLGRGAMTAAPITPPAMRSLSAVTWLIHAKTSGFPLLRHNVFFSPHYASEFDDIFRRKQLPADPTIYICAQDRGDTVNFYAPRQERLLCLVNAPPVGDQRPFSEPEIEQCRNRVFNRLKSCGLQVETSTMAMQATTPADFNRLYPSTGGALYGRASHGWMASFQRPHSRSRIPGLYLAGGSVHPGPGVPMAAISGRLAARSVIADLDSTTKSRATGMRGGTSTR